MAFSPTTSKSVSKAAPKASAGSRPTHSLKVRPKDSKDSINLTGLWNQVSKKGVEYLSGKDKEQNIRYMVFSSKKGENVRELRYKEGDGDLVTVCALEQATSKKGDVFFSGKSEEGHTYFLFVNTPRD